MKKCRPFLTSCGMYVAESEWSNIDLQIWDKKDHHVIPDPQVENTLPYLTACIPQVVNNGQYLFIISGFTWNNMQLHHYFTPERFGILSPQFEKEKKWSNKDFGGEWTWTGDNLLKNPQSIHPGCLWFDECRWKKIGQTISVPPPTSTVLASFRYAQRRSRSSV